MKYLLLGLLCLVQLGHATTLKLSTFNIKWFGLGGSLGGSIEEETRIPALKKLWQDHLANNDVIMFQEIVNTELFITEVAPEEFNCLSYQHDWHKHQHVVICHQNIYSFRKEINDDNYIIEDVSLWRYRPAISGVLVDQDGNDLIHLIGVHLKADTHSTDLRTQQIEQIGNSIAQFNDQLPVAILGDFNTYIAPYNGHEEDDTTIFSNILETYGLRWIENTMGTYVTKWRRRTLDHFWISANAQITENLSVYQTCRQNNALSNQEYFLSIGNYNKEISDHCPLSIGINI